MDLVSYCTDRVKCGYVQPLCVYSPRRQSVVIIKPSITLESGKNLFFAFSLIDWLRQPLTSSLAGLKLTEITCLCLPLHTPHTWVSFSLFDSLRLGQELLCKEWAITLCFRLFLTCCFILFETPHLIELSYIWITLVWVRRYLMAVNIKSRT